MRERALLVDGALAIKKSPHGGVEVRLEVPTTPVDEPVGVKS
jgi:signal transduction histidine kinase